MASRSVSGALSRGGASGRASPMIAFGAPMKGALDKPDAGGSPSGR
jgi:hypothetical protein